MAFFKSLILFVCLFHLYKTCPLKTVNIQTGCYCGIEIDGTNYIHCHPYSISQIPSFSRSYIYDKLNISSNYIQIITNRSFINLRVRKIYLENNLIRTIDSHTFETIGNYLEELTIHTINNNQDLTFLCYGTWKKLRYLELIGFNISITTKMLQCFQNLKRLEKLVIKNSIVLELSHYFYTLPMLNDLILTDNQLEYLKIVDNSHQISNIKILNLTKNLLSNISEISKILIKFPKLHTLDLSYNKFYQLSQSLPIKNINFSHNYIRHLTLDNTILLDNVNYDLSSNQLCTLSYSNKSIYQQQNHRHINLSNNRIHCDCRLAYFFFNNDQQLLLSLKKSPPNLFEYATCTTPNNVEGKLLSNLTYEQLLSHCSSSLPDDCQDVYDFNKIKMFVKHHTQHSNNKINNENILISSKIFQRYSKPFNSSRSTKKMILKETNVNSPSSLSSSLYKSSLQLTSFYTIYENNNLIVLWDYNDDSIIHDITQFQIILEQEIIADHTMNPNVIVRRSGSLSSNIKKYIIRHVQPNMKYFVCISITRFGHGTDKYCRDILTTVSSLTTDYRLLQSVSTSSTKIVNSLLWNLLSNKSVLFGFFVGTTITSSLLLILTLTCHKIRKYRQEKSTTANLFEQHYMYADGNYSNSICEHHDEQKLYDYLKYQSKTSRKRQSSCLSLCFRKKLINHRQLSTTSFPTTSDNANYTTCRGGGDDNTSASTLSESEQLSKHVYQEIGNDLIEGHKNFQIVRHYFDPKHEQTALRRPIHITIFPNENSITSKTNLLL